MCGRVFCGDVHGPSFVPLLCLVDRRFIMANSVESDSESDSLLRLISMSPEEIDERAKKKKRESYIEKDEKTKERELEFSLARIRAQTLVALDLHRPALPPPGPGRL